MKDPKTSALLVRVTGRRLEKPVSDSALSSGRRRVGTIGCGVGKDGNTSEPAD